MKVILNQDIKKIKPIKIEKYLNKKKTIIIGGPPCQPFSKNGYWITNKNRKITKDPRNCINDFLRFVEELNPDGFLIENVESILHPTNKKAVEFILKKTNKMEYNIKMVRANALDYGVPQERKRVFFIASKKKLNGNGLKVIHQTSLIMKLIDSLENRQKLLSLRRRFNLNIF